MPLSADPAHVYAPRPTGRAFYECCIETYPALSDPVSGSVYRGLLNHLALDWCVDECGRVPVTHARLAALCGCTPNHGAFRSGPILDAFSREVAPLDVTGYRRGESARRARIELAPEILPVLREEHVARARRSPRELIDWATGAPVRLREHDLAAIDDRLASLASEAEPDHPAAELLEYLNTTTPRVSRYVLRKNWDLVTAAAEAMPRDTPEQERRTDYTMRLLGALRDNDWMWGYAPARETVRLFPSGASANLLPREIRRVAYQGCASLDLTACQFAVLMVVFEQLGVRDAGLDEARRIVERDGKPWAEMMSWARTDDKQAIKTVIYALSFGLAERSHPSRTRPGETVQGLKSMLRDGTRTSARASTAGLGTGRMRRFFRHPVIEALLRARKMALEAIDRSGGADDAWGRRISAVDFRPNQVLARVAQSYEMRIMLAPLDYIRSHRDLGIAAWLHDGVIVRCRDRAEADGQLGKVAGLINAAARDLGMATRAEIEWLLPTG